MLRSFLNITLRILWRNKVTTFVNIFSLSVGITAFILILLYVHHETRYDKFNENYNRIYRLEGDNYGKLPPVVGTYVRDRVPEVKNIARLALGSGKIWISYIPDYNPDNIKEIQANFFYADSTAFEVFTFPFIHGDPNTALEKPFTAVITESIAHKLFGDENPMSKNIVFNDHSYIVTGIIKDVENSHIEIDALFSQESIPKVFPDRDLNNTGRNAWLWSATYLLMTDKINENLVEEKINKVLAEINDGNLFDLQFKHFHIRPFKDIYFNGVTKNLPYGLHGNMKLIQVFFAIGIFMLVLACINYINLTTARSTIRSKEVAIKMVAGSSVNLLRGQLIIESVIVTLISMVVAMTILQVFLSKFNQMVMVDIPLVELNRPEVWGLLIMGGLLLGIIAGIYPAIYMTSIKPVILMKGEGIKGSGRSLFRRSLMTFQFVTSIVMIIGIIVNLRQLHYIRTADLGFNKEKIITIVTPTDKDDPFTLRETFRDRLLQYPEIKNVAYSAGNPGEEVPTAPFVIDGVKRALNFFLIDNNYLDVMGIKVSEGKGFSIDKIGDRASESDVSRQSNSTRDNQNSSGFLLNESAVRELGLDSPIGKIIYWYDGKREVPLEIIGIVKDFHFRSLHDKIEPIGFFWTPPMHSASIKVSSDNLAGTLKNIEREWKTIFGQKRYVYKFLDETFEQQYKSDEQLAIIIGYFTILAVIIACLGLFALSSFLVSRRTKEIGIRKTLGASIATIYVMLSWDFLKWIILALIIASPMAWFLMNHWIEDFAYHITLKMDIFILATLITIIIALITVNWQSLKTASANPVEALRYE